MYLGYSLILDCNLINVSSTFGYLPNLWIYPRGNFFNVTNGYSISSKAKDDSNGILFGFDVFGVTFAFPSTEHEPWMGTLNFNLK